MCGVTHAAGVRVSRHLGACAALGWSIVLSTVGALVPMGGREEIGVGGRPHSVELKFLESQVSACG